MIVVSDIFGNTPALIKFSKVLDVKVIIDPYNGRTMNFKNEDEAYSYFIKNVGFKKYLSILLKEIESIGAIETLIGFSIGASIIWALSEHASLKNIKCGICYYGSQIRNVKAINPSFNVQLIFPKQEAHFDVLSLASELSKKQNVDVIKTIYLHGFMNLYSTNYNRTAYIEQLYWLRSNILNK